jgi:hypothetical protein
MKVRER